MTHELYIRVLEYIQDKNNYTSNQKLVEEKNFVIIGDVIIKSVMEDMPEIEQLQIKKIVCNYLGYTQEQFSNTTYDDLCLLISKKIAKFKSYPADKYQELLQKYYEVKTRYSTVISDIENKIITIDSRIKVDNEHPQLCGTLIQQQQRIRCSSEADKSLLKDLKQIEIKYYALIDEIQENYIYQEMLNYAKNKMEEYLGNTILKMSEEDATAALIKMAIEMSKEDSSDFGELSAYDNCLKSWENATQSIYKPFYMIKMRKFIYDIECFCDSGYNGEYWNRLDELMQICKEKREKIYDSDKWIELRENQEEYMRELQRHISEFNVLDYIKDKADNLFCLQSRKNMLYAIIDAFKNEKFDIFINLVAIQIEGLIYDMFVDENIQTRLYGNFDLFEKDDLKTKFTKNDVNSGIEEASLYFKFYFNNMIRNKIAHGRSCSEKEEETSYELLLDLQYVIHLLENRSDTNEAIQYIKNKVRWLHFTHSGESSTKQIYERLLNTLNENVIRRTMNYIGYVDSQQELYWIFNPYYDEAYEFADVIEQRDVLRDYLTSEDFWNYVLDYIKDYDEQEIPRIKLKAIFKSRVRALQSHIAKNKSETLPIVVEVSKALEVVL